MTNRRKRIREALKVRMQLLKIWFLKNITVFIKILFILALILFACGILDNTIPVIGELSQEFEELAKANSWQVIIKCLEAIAMIGASVYMFLRKTKRLAIDDIQTKKLKIALIKANLYFDENGRLRKKPVGEEAVFDEDYDTGVANIIDAPRENIVDGVVRATSELGVVLTAEIKTSDGSEKILQEAQLTEENLDEEINNKKEKLHLLKSIFGKTKSFKNNLIASLKFAKNPKIKKEKQPKIKNEKEEIVSSVEDNIEIVNVDSPSEVIEEVKPVIEEKPVETKIEETKDITTLDVKKPVENTKPKVMTQRDIKINKINDILNSLK